MKLHQPHYVHIGCHTYRIEVGNFPDMHDEHVKADVNWRLGLIRIHGNRPHSEKLVSLLHEFIHIAAEHLCKGDPEVPESLANALAEGLAQMLQSIGVEFDWGEEGSEVA